jgi:aspergillopepsin I
VLLRKASNTILHRSPDVFDATLIFTNVSIDALSSKMHPFHSSVGLALAWGITTNYATPLSILDQLSTRQTFSLEEVEVERKTPWSAPHAIRDTYLKYGAEPPEYIEEAIRNAALPPPGGGQASAEARLIQGDKEYLISVQVGNHNLSLDLDTGSADL